MLLNSIGRTDTTSSRLMPRMVEASSEAPNTGQEVKDTFLEYARMTPAERVQEAVFKMLGITEEKLAGMSPEQRQAMDEEIKKKLAELIKQKQETIVGAIADVKI